MLELQRNMEVLAKEMLGRRGEFVWLSRSNSATKGPTFETQSKVLLQMSPTIKLAAQLHKIATQWPVDPFRPHLQLKTFLGSLAEHPQLTPSAVSAARALENNEFQKKVRLCTSLESKSDAQTHPSIVFLKRL